MTDVDQRYRGPSPLQRIVALALVVGLVVTGVGLLGWTVLFHSNPEVRSQLLTFEVRDQHEAVATVTVARADQFVDASCRVRAIAADHAIVGEVIAVVSEGPATQTLDVAVRTEREATSVELLGCTAEGQPRPR